MTKVDGSPMQDQRNDLIGAKETAETAKSNADNYRMLTMALYFAIMRDSDWSVDPDNLGMVRQAVSTHVPTVLPLATSRDAGQVPEV
jgi:hypothetical protein